MRVLAATATLLALALPAAYGADGKTVKVHVFAGTAPAGAESERKARTRQADDERKRAEKARKDLDKALAARHGKRSQDWPEDARRQSEEAWTAELRATLAHAVEKTDQKGLSDSAGDLAKALAGEIKKRPRVALVETADGADLAVEVLARASRTSFPAAAWLLYLKVTPAASAASPTFVGKPFDQVKGRESYLGQILGTQNLHGSVATVHAYTEAEPYWIVQVFQQGTGWGHVAWTAAEVLAAFSDDMAEDGARASR